MKSSGDLLYNTVYILNTTELYSYKWLKWKFYICIYVITIFKIFNYFKNIYTRTSSSKDTIKKMNDQL